MGVYLGASKKPECIYHRICQVKYFEELEMRFDAGFMVRLSLEIKKWENYTSDTIMGCFQPFL